MSIKFNPFTGQLDLVGTSAVASSDSPLDALEQDGSYYITATSSDLGGGRYTMTRDIPPAGGGSVSQSALTDGDVIATFASVDGYPNVTELPAGPLSFHIKAQQTSGTKTVRVYAEFYFRTLLGVDTLLGTSDYSTTLTGGVDSIRALATMQTTRGIGLTDRLMVVFKAEVTGTGTDPEVTIYLQGTNYSQVRFPFDNLSLSDLGSKQDSILANNNEFIYQNASGVIVGNSNLTFNPNFGSVSLDMTAEPDNNTSTGVCFKTLNINPQQNSPLEGYTLDQIQINIDQSNSGFTFGTLGEAISVKTSNIFHEGTSDIGSINFIKNYANLGNGVDSIDVGGFSYAFGFMDVNANVNISGAMQGYGFQPSFDSSVTVDDSGGYVNAFYDFTNATGVEFGSYTTFTASPTLGSIANNRNFSGLSFNPTITTFTGNASCYVINIGGDYGSFGTGSWQGVNINPNNITTVSNAIGLYINMDNVTATSKRAIDVNGDVNFQGDFTNSGLANLGRVSAFYGDIPVNGGGNPLTLQSMVSQVIAQDSVTVANADTIGMNNTMLVELQDDSITASGPFKLGFSAVVAPSVVKTGTGSSLDFMNMAVYALNLDVTSTGGTLGRVNGARVEAIPNGVTTVNEFVAFEFNQTFGQVGTDVWGLHLVPSYAENFIGGSLCIGTSSQKVTNSSVALEIGGVTKALRHANMTTTERGSLTPLAGMVIFNTTTSKHQGYDGSTWNDLY